MSESHAFTTSRALGERVLQLLQDLRTPEGLAPDRIERIFGHPVRHSDSRPGVYGFGQTLDERWICNFVTLPRADAPERPNRFEFSFDDQTGEYSNLSAVSGLDFDAYASALGAAGYAMHVSLGSNGTFYGYRFDRGPTSVHLRLRARSAERPAHLCVESLVAEVAEVRHA